MFHRKLFNWQQRPFSQIKLGYLWEFSKHLTFFVLNFNCFVNQTSNFTKLCSTSSTSCFHGVFFATYTQNHQTDSSYMPLQFYRSQIIFFLTFLKFKCSCSVCFLERPEMSFFVDFSIFKTSGYQYNFKANSAGWIKSSNVLLLYLERGFWKNTSFEFILDFSFFWVQFLRVFWRWSNFFCGKTTN